MLGTDGSQQEQRPKGQEDKLHQPSPAVPRQERSGLHLPQGLPKSLPELLRVLSPERADKTTQVPLSEVMTFQHQTGLYHEGTLRNDRMWLTIAPIVSYANAFARRHHTDTPIARGSAVRHAAFIARDLDAMRDRLDAGEPIEELDRLGGEGMTKRDLNETLLLLTRSKRDIPSQFFRTDIYPDMVRDFHIDQLQRLRPQDGRDIQELYYGLFAGPDLDIKLPPTDERTTLLFYQRLFGFVLPQMASNIATSDCIQYPDIVDGQMKRFAGNHPPELTVDHHVPLPNTLDRIMQARSLSELSSVVDYTIDVPIEVAMRPIWEKRFNSKGQEVISTEDPLPELTLSAKLIPIRGEALYVGQITYGAAYDFRMSDGTIQRRIQPLFTIDLPSRAPRGQELADARYSTGATNYDYTGVKIAIHPASPFKKILYDTSERLEAHMLIPPAAKTKLNEAVQLGPDWSQTTEPQGLEIATRALWQGVDSRFHDPERNGSYVSPAAIDAIRQRITSTGKIELLRQCNTPEGQFARTSLQKNLMIMALVSPHDFVRYTGETGIWNLLFTQGDAPAYQEILNTLEGKISDVDYQNKLSSDPRTGEGRPDISGWELINSVLVSLPDVREQFQELIPDFKPSDWITNMYYLTSLLTSSPK